MNTYQATLPSVEQVYIRALTSRQITASDFNLLTLIVQCPSLSEEDRRAVKRVFYALQRGWLTLVEVPSEYLVQLQSWLHETGVA